MKLIYCPLCHDVVKLHDRPEARMCLCRRSWGRYVDPKNALIGGKAIPLGIGNISLMRAVGSRAGGGQGERFEGFVIPEGSESVRRE